MTPMRIQNHGTAIAGRIVRNAGNRTQEIRLSLYSCIDLDPARARKLAGWLLAAAKEIELHAAAELLGRKKRPKDQN